uniref:Uncharacterized protein n=1 Tax=Clastoptera arizonana TaxID=38151 RepID=A0A1B6EBZ5_9HEMI
MLTGVDMATQHADIFHKESTFSFVVDDVDARNDQDDSQVLHKLINDAALDLRPCSQCKDKEQSDARIQQIKVEAESRKIAFARLLEEHAQVIRRLKHLEEDGAALNTSQA